MKASKKNNLQWLSLGLIPFITLTAFTLMRSSHSSTPPPGDGKLEIPAEINSILDKSCLGCHNVDSKNDKAKDKLLLDKLPELSNVKLISKLDKISEMVEKNEMPPEKFLAKFPDKALTAEEAKQLREWAESASESILKK